MAGLKSASADVVVLDAFHGGRVPTELTTSEFLAEVARVLRPTGIFLANVADGPPLTYLRRVAATARAVFGHVLLRADPGVLKGRRFGNVVLAASAGELATDEIARQAAAAMFRQHVLAGAALRTFVGRAAALTDADPMRSPAPPDEIWRVGD
jgi:spermidine synthase